MEQSSSHSQCGNMKIAFFGRYGSFDHGHIGGTNSLVRRLSTELVRRWHFQVDHVLYGQATREITHLPGLRSRYYRTLSEALEVLTEYDHVVTIYLPPRDLLTYMHFRARHRRITQFHMLYQIWPESAVKRELMFALNRVIPFSGRSFAISPRLVHRIKHWDRQAVLLWPPVPPYYYMPLSQKTFSDKIRISFLGRIDMGKGVLETIDIFNALADCSEVKIVFYGIYWESDPTAVQLHHQLSKQRHFPYMPIKFTNHSDQIDEMVRSVLRDTDIFIQPYRKLSSTIDTPLLILEAMASLCAVITKPYGDIPHIYGKSPCLIDAPQLCEQAIKLILSAKEWLPSERERIERQNKSLHFDTPSVAERFVDALNTSTETEGSL